MNHAAPCMGVLPNYTRTDVVTRDAVYGVTGVGMHVTL